MTKSSTSQSCDQEPSVEKCRATATLGGNEFICNREPHEQEPIPHHHFIRRFT